MTVQVQRTGRLFQAWFATVRYHLGAKKAKRQCKERKKLEIRGLLQQAEAAAGRGDQRSVYQVVKQLAPWAPRNRVLLKDKEGRLLTHKEENDALVSHSRALFAPQQSQPSRAGVKLPLDFPLQDVERQLQATKIGKAVPKHVAPAAARRIGAAAIAPHLKTSLSVERDSRRLPTRALDGRVDHAPSQPAALRPIGLMYPEAKVLAALIKERLYDHIRPQLEWVPQFAYQPGRDLHDALARVHAWCGLCREKLNTFTPGRFAMKEREATGDIAIYALEVRS
ncbi:jockey\pol [Symbiodinium sp. CCMP2456]|nr:jockey\pol [Symbiodinium sp. CCMP2456]